MTRSFSFAVIASALIAAPALAGTIPAEMDIDGSGTLSLQEMQAAFPTMSETTFGLIDLNSDGEADDDEVAAAVEAGYLVVNG